MESGSLPCRLESVNKLSVSRHKMDNCTACYVERLQKSPITPRMNVVVDRTCSVNQALDRVAIIVDEKYDWLLVKADHSGEFLGSHLESSIADEKQLLGRSSVSTFQSMKRYEGRVKDGGVRLEAIQVDRIGHVPL
jgi:hypothetical protein